MINLQNAKPFLKWAGGKGQLINDISSNLPQPMDGINTLVEPFVGSGAIFFWIVKTYPSIRRVIINDYNTDLVNTYLAIKYDINNLVHKLHKLGSQYMLLDMNGRQELFYYIRDKYNHRENILDKTEIASYFIFLNKTCFNGLYRVNGKNKFNVPFGKYISPIICDEHTLLADSELLQKVEIRNGDYTSCIDVAGPHTLYYFDPPYRPLSTTSSFNSYTKETFDDRQQERLKDFCDKIHKCGSMFLLSNSDPLSANQDPYFDLLYKGYSIQRVQAKRNINSKANKRGAISEILVKNY